MSVQRAVGVFVGLMLTVAAVSAQTKPDFSGTWRLDTAKTEPAPEMPGMSFPPDAPQLVIKQTATDLLIDQGTNKSSFKLDGTDSTNTGAAGMPVVTKTRWDGAAIVTQGSANMGGMAVEFTTTRTLSDDGKVMTIEAWGKMDMGEGTRRIVYTKS